MEAMLLIRHTKKRLMKGIVKSNTTHYAMRVLRTFMKKGLVNKDGKKIKA